MYMPSIKRVAGAFVAALTLSLVATVAPAAAASAAPAPTAKIVKIDRSVKTDSGWG